MPKHANLASTSGVLLDMGYVYFGSMFRSPARPCRPSPRSSSHCPRLLEQYAYGASLTERYSGEAGARAVDRKEHFEVVLAAIAAGRAEIVRLHRLRMIHDEVLRTLESDLDLQELAARAVVNERMSYQLDRGLPIN